MDLSTLVARILAVIYISAGISALRGKTTFRQMIEDFERSPALTYISGFMTVIFGMILVTYHNLWVRDWPVLITLVGWLALFKGVLLIAFPEYLSRFRNAYGKTRIWGVFMIGIGLLFGYFGVLI